MLAIYTPTCLELTQIIDTAHNNLLDVLFTNFDNTGITSVHVAWSKHMRPWLLTRCGNKETGLLLLLISGHVDDEEEGRALTRGPPFTVTQRFIHAHRLVWL